MKNDIQRRAEEQFSHRAQAYVSSEIHAKGSDLDLILQIAGNLTGQTVLDIATGAGHTAIRMALAGASVTATDLSQSMLDVASNQAKASGVSMSYKKCAAEHLPFADASFDIVTCRIAPHHFADPAGFVAESARVLKKNGEFLLIDNISPTDKSLRGVVNEVERRRDSSHVEAYTVKTWIDWLSAAKLELESFYRWQRVKIFTDWCDVSGMTVQNRDKLEDYVLSLRQTAQIYLNVTTKEGRLASLCHETALFAARK